MSFVHSHGRQRRGGRALLLVALAACLGAANGSARADRASVQLYAGLEAPEGPERLSEALSELLRTEGFELVDMFEEARAAVEGGAVLEDQLVAFSRANELLEEGWRSYLEVRPSFAAARLAQARTEALAVAHLQGGRELLAEISLRLGATKLDIERQAEAADDFRLVHMLAPERRVSDSEFKPEVVVAFDAAIAQERSWQARPVEREPASAKLWIDGEPLAANLAEVSLQDGLHLVSAQEPGYQGSSQLVSVSAGVVAPVRVRMDVDPLAQRVLGGAATLAGGVAEDEATQALGALVLYAQVDSVLLVASVWRREQPALLAQLCTGQPARCSRVVEVGYPEGGLLVAVSELWRNLRRAGGRFPPTLQNDERLLVSEKRPIGGGGGSRSWLSNRWLWVGVAAASIAGSAIYLLSGDQEIRPVFVGEPCSFGGC